MKVNPPASAKRPVGVHLRLEQSYAQILEEAITYNVPICQFFFMPQGLNKYLRLTEEDKSKFLELRRAQNITVYGHSSYWINPATCNLLSSSISQSLLRKEIRIAQELEIPYLVLHAGSAKDFTPTPESPTFKEAGLKSFAKILNHVLKNRENITVLVENTAHANKAVCSDLEDFKFLLTLLDEPEKVGFCIDTAHAFAYGYDVEKTEDFIQTLDQTMGLSKIKLIHLNDSEKACGTRLDTHTLPGKGLIGEEVLKNFATHPKLESIPIIIEPPVVAVEEIKTAIEEINGW